MRPLSYMDELIKRPMFMLGTIYAITYAGFFVWRASFQNFAVEYFNLGATEIGFLFSLSAVPGVLAFGYGIAAAQVRVPLLLVFCAGCVGLGLIWIGLAAHEDLLWLGVLLISLGFTGVYSLINSLTILAARASFTARALGRLKSIGPFASLAVALVLFILFEVDSRGLRPVLGLTGLAVVLCGSAAALALRNRQFAIKRNVFRLEPSLWPYYALNFLAGCRSAIFKTFVIFMLVSEHGVALGPTALIVLAGTLLSAVGYRWIGWLGDRYDRRLVLACIYLAVVVIFICFCFDLPAWIIVSLFLVDSLLFGASVITDSSLASSSTTRGIVGNVAAGVTLFALASVVMPYVGGLVWDHVSSRATFILGACLAGLAVWMCSKLGKA